MFRKMLFRIRRAPRPASPETLPPPEDEAAGCGWFDSSDDLRRGLSVTEVPVGEYVYGRGLRLQSGNGLGRH